MAKRPRKSKQGKTTKWRLSTIACGPNINKQPGDVIELTAAEVEMHKAQMTGQPVDDDMPAKAPRKRGGKKAAEAEAAAAAEAEAAAAAEAEAAAAGTEAAATAGTEAAAAGTVAAAEPSPAVAARKQGGKKLAEAAAGPQSNKS